MARKTIVIDESEREIVPFKYSITSYGADYPVDSLVQRLDKDVVVVPAFQRKYVWTVRQACRFIESLLLGLTVPGIFLSKEPETGVLGLGSCHGKYLISNRIVLKKPPKNGPITRFSRAKKQLFPRVYGKSKETLHSRLGLAYDDPQAARRCAPHNHADAAADPIGKQACLRSRC
jgi:hypothetical protein